jgi:hypothetical protein
MFVLPFLWMTLFGLQAQVEYDPEAMAKEARQRAIQAAEKEIDRIETGIKNASKAKDAEQLKTLRQDLKAAKESLAEAKSKKHADYVAEAEEKIKKWRAATANYAEQARQEEERKQQEAKQIAEAKAKFLVIKKQTGPVFIDIAEVQRNAIGLPELKVWVSNTTDSEIEAFEVEAECFNSFDEPVKDLTGSNVFKGVCTTALNPREQSSFSWQLSLQGGTTRAVVWVKRVKLVDGEVWSQTRAEAEKKKYGLTTANKAKQ